MRLILTGVTGFVGNEVLYQAINDSGIERVVAITRRPSGTSHAKLTEVVLRNFLDYSEIGEHLKADACIWCLGVSQTEVDKEEYIRITHDYTLAAARAMFAANPRMQFCFVSGRGADQDEKSRTLFGKIKGRTEKDLQTLNEERRQLSSRLHPTVRA